MTITIDSRVGSKDLMAYLPKAKARLGRLEYGDASWLGSGPEGVPVMVGVELKRLLDMLQSMQNGRFAGYQLPGLQACYEVVYLIVEGDYRPNPRNGLLEKPIGKRWVSVELGTRRFMYQELEGFLNTQDVLGKVRVRRTKDPRHTAQLLLALHHWWTDKTWEEHRSHLALDESGGLAGGFLTKPGLKRRVAKELPGIGWGRSIAVAEHFESVREMVNAEREEWMGIPGIDKVISEKVVESIRRKG